MASIRSNKQHFWFFHQISYGPKTLGESYQKWHVSSSKWNTISRVTRGLISQPKSSSEHLLSRGGFFWETKSYNSASKSLHCKSIEWYFQWFIPLFKLHVPVTTSFIFPSKIFGWKYWFEKVDMIPFIDILLVRNIQKLFNNILLSRPSNFYFTPSILKVMLLPTQRFDFVNQEINQSYETLKKDPLENDFIWSMSQNTENRKTLKNANEIDFVVIQLMFLGN